MYLVLGLVWLALMACHYRDLLPLQFWIGAVIAIGMLLSSLLSAQYQYQYQ